MHFNYRFTPCARFNKMALLWHFNRRRLNGGAYIRLSFLPPGIDMLFTTKKSARIALFAAALVCGAPAMSQTKAAPADPNVEIVFWNSVKDSQDARELQAYLDKYPNGQFAPLAQIRLKNLQGAQSKPAPQSAASAAPAPSSSPASETVDERFYALTREVNAFAAQNRRLDVRHVLPMIFPVQEPYMTKVRQQASKIHRLGHFSSAAISISPSGKVAIGSGMNTAWPDRADNEALASCESKRGNTNDGSPKCEVFYNSQVVNRTVLLRMLGRAHGPDFDKWIKGVGESVATW